MSGWIQQAQDVVQWRSFLKAVMDRKVEKILVGVNDHDSAAAS